MWLTRASTLQERTKLDGIDFKNVITAAELVRLQWRPHGWLLWQMIPQGGITLLAGETASGKSFLGLDLALGVASGRGKAWDMELGESQESAKPPILSDTDTLPRFTDPPSREGYIYSHPLGLQSSSRLGSSTDPLPLRALRLKGGQYSKRTGD